MNPRKVLLLSMAFTAMGTWAQSALGNLPEVNVNDVEIMSVSEIEFSSRDSIVIDPVTGRADTLIIDEGITSIKPIDEATEQARAPRRSPSTSDKDLYGGLTDAGKQLIGSGAYLYTYKYPSVDADGNKVILSALMGVPRWQLNMGFAAPSNVLIACHETITSNWECPTSYNNGDNGGDWKTGVGMMLMYTRYDRTRQPCCLVIMPDYEGYGITADRAHPYLYQELTARQVVDAVRYGLAFYNANVGTGKNFKALESNWQSVSLGYSQGGSVALAVHKFIEQNGLDTDLNYAGSVCGDGPYDPVAHLRYYITDNGETYDGSKKTKHKAGTVSMPIVMPLILKGMCDSNPLMRQHSIDEYLSDKFLATGSLQMIEAKKNPNKADQFSTDDVTKRYVWQSEHGVTRAFTLPRPYGGNASVGGSFTAAQMSDMFYYTSTPFLFFGTLAAYGKLSEMLTPDCYTYFTTKSNFEDAGGNRVTPTGRGFMQDLHRALESNNLTVGWTPKHRVAFYHSSYDTVVPFVNLCSFVKNQPYLYYYIQPKTDDITTEIPSYRLSEAGAYPLWPIGDPDKADVYINDTNSSDDHVGAGKDFFMLGKVLGTSPDYALFKWVLKKKTD